jgi:hypothetical protein
VVSNLLGEDDLEDALTEYYENTISIEHLAQQPVKRGLFGGLDDYRTIETALPVLILMARQCALKAFIHGHSEISVTGQAFIEDEAKVDNIGEFIDHLIGVKLADNYKEDLVNFVPVSMFTNDIELD